MKSYQSIITILSVLVCVLNAQVYLNTITPTPTNVLQSFNLDDSSDFSTVFLNASMNIFSVIYRDTTQEDLQFVASFDSNSISVVNSNYTSGSIYKVKTVPLPNNLQTSQLSSFFTSYWNPPMVYFLSQVDTVVSLNSLNLNNHRISTWNLLNQKVSSVQGVLNTQGNYLVVSVLNNQYIAVDVDPSSKSIVQKAQIAPSHTPAQIFKLVGFNSNSFIYELQGPNVFIQQVNWKDNSLTLVSTVVVGPGVTDINVFFNQGWVLMTVYIFEKTDVYIISNYDFSIEKYTTLPIAQSETCVLFAHY
ncbi:hypothetical protein CYY_000521 [Polysphondylium violaceum]|uniref:Uncharacterized protein n=1 Tax=Polysphondylium violaceum TaxID=133409 RepID=A0A8J4V8U0_9MYCE|nr:hypothetical protein CYY_000521 [Polysphondylium violaceum]